MKLIDSNDVVHYAWGASLNAQRLALTDEQVLDETRCSDPFQIRLNLFTGTDRRAVTCIECLALGPHALLKP